jgi:hypothetical protein
MTCGNHDYNRKFRLESLKKVEGLRDIIMDGEILPDRIIKKQVDKQWTGLV